MINFETAKLDCICAGSYVIFDVNEHLHDKFMTAGW